MNRGTIRKVGPFTQTTAALNSRPADTFKGIRDFDREPGDGQHLARVKERAAMGQKKTPMAGFVLKR